MRRFVIDSSYLVRIIGQLKRLIISLEVGTCVSVNMLSIFGLRVVNKGQSPFGLVAVATKKQKIEGDADGIN